MLLLNMDDNLLKEGLLWFTSHKIQIHSLIFLDTRPKMSEIVLQTIDDLGFFFDTAWYENCSWIFLTNNFWYSGIQSKKVLEKVTCFVPLSNQIIAILRISAWEQISKGDDCLFSVWKRIEELWSNLFYSVIP